MPIVLVRVDDRFIHGQILEGWLPITKAQEVLVANDDLANDEIQTMIMESAIPSAIRLIVDTVEGIAAIIKSTTDEETRRMIIVDNPSDALRLKRAGVAFDILNLGNLRTTSFTKSLSRSVLVGEDTLETLCDILHEGVKVSIQAVPFEKAIFLDDFCHCEARR